MGTQTSLKSGKRKDRSELLNARLKLIRERHRLLILEPRHVIAADLADELWDGLDELANPDGFPLTDTADAAGK